MSTFKFISTKSFYSKNYVILLSFSPVCGKQVPSFTINSHLDSSACNSSSSPSTHTQPSTSTKRKSSSISHDPPPSSSASTSTKKFKSTTAVENAKPLAERVRPKTLQEFVGQEHLLGEGRMLRNLIDKDKLGSLILWGPPVCRSLWTGLPVSPSRS